MTLERGLELILGNLGTLVTLLMFAWLWISGRIVSRAELERTLEQIRGERDHARGEAKEWKYMAMRGTDLAKFLGEKATTPP